MPAARVVCLSALVLLCACGSLRSPPPFAQQGSSGASGSALPPPATGTAVPPSARPPPRQFRLGPAATSLVSQAHTQLNGGDFGLAAATIERAMRVEPDNPLLWIELGRVRYTAGDVAQAQSMGRKALVLATGDPRAQSSAWKLIADSLRAQRRNPEAADADRHAQELLQR